MTLAKKLRDETRSAGELRRHYLNLSNWILWDLDNDYRHQLSRDYWGIDLGIHYLPSRGIYDGLNKNLQEETM